MNVYHFKKNSDTLYFLPLQIFFFFISSEIDKETNLNILERMSCQHQHKKYVVLPAVNLH
jgi:hypothetical protein